MNFINVPKKYQDEVVKEKAIEAFILKEYDSCATETVIRDMAFDILCLRENYESKCDDNYILYRKNMELRNKLKLANNKKHIYKVELARCQRKLTRIYKFFNDVIYFANERSVMSFKTANAHKESAILHNAIARIIRALDRKSLRKL